MTRIFHLSFNEDLYETQITNGMIVRITRFSGEDQFARECLFDDLPRHIKIAIVEEIINEEPENAS